MPWSDFATLCGAVAAILGTLVSLISLLEAVRKLRARRRRQKTLDGGPSQLPADGNTTSIPDVRQNTPLSPSAWICVGCGLGASVLAAILIALTTFINDHAPGITGLVLFFVICLLFVVSGAAGLDEVWQVRHDPSRDSPGYDAALGVGIAFIAWISVLMVIV